MGHVGTYFAAMFTDLESHSLAWTRTARDDMLGLVAEYRYLAESLASQFGCVYRKFTGDGHLFLFEGADAAALFALELIDAWRSTQTQGALDPPPAHLALRVGCHFGECLPMQDGEDWIGRGINLAKRVEELASADALYVTEGVLELLDIPVYAVEAAGRHALKGDHLAERALYRICSADKARLERRPQDEVSADGWFLRGVALCGTARENTEDEAACYRQALVLRADYPEAHNNLAAVMRALGNPADAAAHYREALRLRPDYPEAHYNYAILLEASGSPGGAVEHYRASLNARPEYVDAHHAYANFLKTRGDLVSAGGHYVEALRIRPNAAEVHNNYAILLEDQRDLVGARGQYEQAIAIRPDFAEAHYNLALLLESVGDRSGAAERYRQAISIVPSYAEAHNNLAIVLQLQGDLDRAAAHFAEALRLRPNDPETHYNFALLLKARGDHEAAREHFRVASEIAPEIEAYRTASEHAGAGP